MEELELGLDIKHEDTMKERLVKMLVVSTAGFVASALAERVIDNVLEKRRRVRL